MQNRPRYDWDELLARNSDAFRSVEEAKRIQRLEMALAERPRDGREAAKKRFDGAWAYLRGETHAFWEEYVKKTAEREKVAYEEDNDAELSPEVTTCICQTGNC